MLARSPLSAPGQRPVADVAELGATEDRRDESVWVAQLAPGALAASDRAAQVSPAAYQRTLPQGRSTADVVYGPNRVAGASIASLWWFYVGVLAGGPPDRATSAKAPSACPTPTSGPR